MSNVYYHPEALGLQPIDELDAGESYEFNIFAVWREADGELYWASDSGCSCPSPFEDYIKLEDFETGTPTQLQLDAEEWIENDSWGVDKDILRGQLVGLMAKVVG